MPVSTGSAIDASVPCDLRDEELNRPVTYSIPFLGVSGAGTVGEFLHDATIHNTHHRGQVTLLLRVLGQVPGNVDILFYYAEAQRPA